MNKMAIRSLLLLWGMLPASAQVTANEASGITAHGFTANWNAAPGATSYRLDVLSQIGTDIAAWRFDAPNTTLTSGTAANTGKSISAVTYSGSYSYPAGVGSLAVASNGWSEGYNNGYNSLHWLVEVSTVGYSNLKISSVQRSSDLGPRDFKLQYRIGTDGTWTDVAGATVTVANNFTSGVLQNISLPAACNNQSRLFLKWVMTSNQAVSGGSVDWSATSMIDNIVLQAGVETYAPGYENLDVGNTTSHVVTGLTPQTAYYYRVRPVIVGWAPSVSNVVGVTTGSEPVPVAEAATQTGSHGFTANWQAYPGATAYRIDVIERSQPDVASWSFDAASATMTSGLAANAGKTIMATTYSGTAGFVAGASGSAYSSNGWQDGANALNWKVEFSTLGQYGIKVSSVQRSSNDGPRNFKLQYSVTPNVWIDVPGATVVVGNDFTTGRLQEVSLPIDCENRTSVSLRWLSTSNTAVGGGTVNFNGTSAIDDIRIRATADTVLSAYNDLNVGNVTQLPIGCLQPLTTYLFKVRAVTIVGTTGSSNGVSATTLAASAPVSLGASNVGETDFTANWAPYPGATDYKLFVYGSSQSDIACWNFNNQLTTPSSCLTANLAKSVTAVTYSGTAGFSGSTGNYALSYNGWQDGYNNGYSSRHWLVEFSTLGQSNLTVSSVQRSEDNGPRDFKLQYRVGLGNWNDVPGATITVGNNLTSGVLTNIALPSACDNQLSVSLKWVMTSNTSVVGGSIPSTAKSFIDDILIKSQPTTVVPGYNGVLTGNVTSFAVSGLTPSTTYSYKVRALSCTSESADSNLVAAGTNSDAVYWNGLFWSNGSGPTDALSAVINGPYHTGLHGSFSANSLTINSSLTVASGTTLHVKRYIKKNGLLPFIIENNANVVQEENSANSGTATVYRNSAPIKLNDYTYWSSPVSGQKLFAFSPLTLTNRFYVLHEPTNAYKGVFASTASGGLGQSTLTYDFEPARGYMVRAPNTYAATLQIFPGVFNGTLQNGDIHIAVTKMGSGYNMIGNPYPSTVDADAFLAANPGTIYFWAHVDQSSAGGQNYATYTRLGGTAAVTGGLIPNGTIQSGQGFMFHTQNAGTVHFTNAMREGNHDNQFYRSANTGRSRIWLNLTGDMVSCQTLIGYAGDATNGLDTAIDGKFAGGSSSSLSSLIEGQPFAIQGRALPFEATDVVPLRFVAAAAGSFTISIAQADGLFSDGQQVFLKDNVSGTVHDLATPYTFTSETGTFNDRFEVVYQAAPLGVSTPSEQAGILAFERTGSLHVMAPGLEINRISVYDLAGRKVLDYRELSGSELAVPFSVPTALYIVDINTSGNVSVKKKVVKH